MALLACLAGPAPAQVAPDGVAPDEAAPRRVLSMNLCTDQLAMLVAAPGQLVSVSWLSRDPRYSPMHREAEAFAVNRGQAEDILRMRPDLVLASSYSSPVTLAMLDRLGLRVERIDAGTDLGGIRDTIERIGVLLDRRPEAARIIAQFDADLAALRARPPSGRRAALYEANGYSAGAGSLADMILAEAGLANVATELGLGAGGFLPLERLVLADPDIVVSARPHSQAARAEEILSHPALRALTARPGAQALTDADWICGTPHVLRAVARLRGPAP